MRHSIYLLARATLALLALLGAGMLTAPDAAACDPGNFYDPTHQVCAPYPPAYPPFNYYPQPSNAPSQTGPDYHVPGYDQ